MKLRAWFKCVKRFHFVPLIDDIFSLEILKQQQLKILWYKHRMLRHCKNFQPSVTSALRIPNVFFHRVRALISTGARRGRSKPTTFFHCCCYNGKAWCSWALCFPNCSGRGKCKQRESLSSRHLSATTWLCCLWVGVKYSSICKWSFMLKEGVFWLKFCQWVYIHNVG